MSSSADTECAGTPTLTALPSRAAIIYFWVILALVNYQLTTNFSFEEQGQAELLRIYHVMLPIFGLWMIKDLASFKLKVEFNGAIAFLVIDLVCNLTAYMRFGFNLTGLSRIIFAGLCYYIGRTIAVRLDYGTFSQQFRRFLTIYFFTVGFQLVLWIIEKGTFNLYIGESTFIGGGINAEAAWVATEAMIFIGSQSFFPILFATVTCGLYNSRSGLLVALFAAASAAYPKLRRYGATTTWTVIGLSCLGVVVITPLLAAAGVNILDRFMHVGGATDSSSSRMALWIAVLVLLKKNIWGYGVGNIMPLIYDVWSGIALPKINNTSQIYTALILEGGIIAFAAYLWMMWRTTVTHFRNPRYRNLYLMMVAYWFTGLTGFYGYDPLFWIIMGVFYTYVRRGEPQYAPAHTTNIASKTTTAQA